MLTAKHDNLLQQMSRYLPVDLQTLYYSLTIFLHYFNSINERHPKFASQKLTLVYFFNKVMPDSFQLYKKGVVLTLGN